MSVVAKHLLVFVKYYTGDCFEQICMLRSCFDRNNSSFFSWPLGIAWVMGSVKFLLSATQLCVTATINSCVLLLTYRWRYLNWSHILTRNNHTRQPSKLYLIIQSRLRMTLSHKIILRPLLIILIIIIIIIIRDDTQLGRSSFQHISCLGMKLRKNNGHINSPRIKLFNPLWLSYVIGDIAKM